MYVYAVYTTHPPTHHLDIKQKTQNTQQHDHSLSLSLMLSHSLSIPLSLSPFIKYTLHPIHRTDEPTGPFPTRPWNEHGKPVEKRWLPADECTAYALAQVLVDIFILNPIYALAFIVTTGLLEGKSMRGEIERTIRKDYVDLVSCLTAVGLVLAPPHVYLFHRFPVKWRVLIADAIDLLWTFLACFMIEKDKR